ncbi:MAG TPA: NAD(P)-dependent alcohol dehydrogenase [Gammaproteobacteria bacterium]|nr:NAD(P)-dependent alcohol dehydrogenase [Gammaproteobacteria bacterium]
MKAYVVVKGSTGVDGLKRVERERPSPGSGEVLVRMRAASLNFRDLAIVNGKYFRGPLTQDTIPLSDGAGEVEAVGANVKAFARGDRVVATFSQGQPPNALGSPLDGTLTEYQVFGEAGLLEIPEHMTFEEAATLPCAGVTVWNALMHGPRVLRPGETVATLGTGGVSVFALQLGKMAGARVIITSSSDEKLARARSLGADEVINYKTTPDWERRVLELTDGQGADHVIDTGGVGTLPHSYQAVGPGGTVSVIGVMTRPEGDLSPYPLMMKAAIVRGIFVGGREHFDGLMRAAAVNKLRPVVDKTYDFDAAPEAYKALKAAQHFGKIVIKI